MNGGVPKEKLVIGMPTYGRGFTLQNPTVNGIGAPASGASVAGLYTREAGFLAYYEVCNELYPNHHISILWIIRVNGYSLRLSVCHVNIMKMNFLKLLLFRYVINLQQGTECFTVNTKSHILSMEMIGWAMMIQKVSR